jgi:hypothetical protein
MAIDSYEAAKNLGLGKGYRVGIMTKRPNLPTGPSGPQLKMPSFKSPNLAVNLPSVNLKSPAFTQIFDPKIRTMYAEDYNSFMANKAAEAAKASNETTPKTPTVMGSPDATAPKPVLGQGNLGTPNVMGGPQGSNFWDKDMEWGIREEQKRQNDILMNMSEQDFNAWLNSTGGGGAPGSVGAAMIEARRRKAGGIPPGAVSVANKEGSFSRWQMPGGEVWETNGKGGWRKARGGENSGILQDPWGPAPTEQELNQPVFEFGDERNPEERKLRQKRQDAIPGVGNINPKTGMYNNF